MDEKRVKIKYRPREQFRSFHSRKERWSVLVCHRRAGKTVATLNDLIRGAVNESKPEGRYAFIFPQRNQAKDTAWRYLRRYAEPLLAKPPNESELRVDLVNGSMIRLYGADNPDALRGPYLDGVVLDEFADMKPEVWHEVVRPMLADRRGWATFIGTPKGKNEFHRLYQNALKDEMWFHMILKASESGIIAPTELADLWREMGEDQYQQEFECIKPDALVMCSDRARPIEDVRVGDSVLTHTGRFRRVTHVMSREFDGDLLKIEAWGSQPIVCTPEHPIRVCDPNSQTYSWKAAKDIVAGDWLVTPKLDHRTDGFIGEALARVIAWYVAEGNVEGGHLTFSLATDETEFIEELCELLKHLGMEPYTRVQENVCMVCVNNAVLSDFLVGVCGSLAPNKRLPLALLRGHERAVWDTLIKGDGCVHVPLGRGRARPVYCYATVSEGLAQQVQIIGASLGYTGSYTISPASKGQIEGREVECRERYNLHMRHASIIDGRNGNKTRSARHAVLGQVISVGCERYHGKIYNLSVAEDESYVVNGRAVHNCSFEAAIKGAFYAEEMRTMLAEGRIRPIEIEKEVRVHTAWDLGVSDSTAIWFIQCVGRERRLVDYYEGSGVGLDHYAQVLHDKRIKHGWSMATITSRTTSK